jgi:XTP/dITP diphosphohydrolase
MISSLAMRRSPSSEVVVASANPGKLREIGAILAQLGIRVLPEAGLVPGAVDESGRSYLENALIKAQHAAAAARLPAIADDSGLEVDALSGAPGLLSARYAGPEACERDNVEKLLRAMAHLGEGERSARFRCVMVYLRHASDPAPLVGEGVWKGRVLRAPRGSQGFGYDPVFYVPTERCSAAELSPEVKNRLSHRAQALRSLYGQLSRARPSAGGCERCA